MQNGINGICFYKLIVLYKVLLISFLSLSNILVDQRVQMSSLLLGDPSKSYFKLSLWREAAPWVERIAAGDIVYFTSELSYYCT